jgi:hypothetical protein
MNTTSIEEKKFRGYVKLIDNIEPEFNHIVNREMPFDEMIIEMKNCGILLSPWREDLLSVDLKPKVKYNFIYPFRMLKQKIVQLMIL